MKLGSIFKPSARQRAAAPTPETGAITSLSLRGAERARQRAAGTTPPARPAPPEPARPSRKPPPTIDSEARPRLPIAPAATKRRAGEESSFAASVRRYMITGAIVTAALVIGFGGWAATARIAGAVIAPGIVVVESNVKTVQHREGGIVSEILVRNGDVVAEGDLLMRLDPTRPRANRAIVAQQLTAFQTRMSRLEAERDHLTKISFDPEILAQMDDPDVAEVVDAQRKVFAARQATISGQTAQLNEQIDQLRQQIVGLSAQRGAKIDEVGLIAEEIADLERLFERQLVPKTRLTALRREMVRLQGEDGELMARIATLHGRISETRMQILQVEKDFQEQVLAEIADIQTEAGNMRERRVAADDELDRIDIRSPQDGYIHELAVFTIGGVVGPGEVLMKIVPRADELVVESRVSPADIDQVQIGQDARVTFSGFDMRTTPRLRGEVASISADLSVDEATGDGYFRVRISLPPEETARLDGQHLLPGMPAEAFIQTNERTVLNYLVKPLADQMRHTFRET